MDCAPFIPHTSVNRIYITLTFPLWDMAAIFSALCIWCLWHMNNLSWSTNVWVTRHHIMNAFLFVPKIHAKYIQKKGSSNTFKQPQYEKTCKFSFSWHWILISTVFRENCVWAQSRGQRKEIYFIHYFSALLITWLQTSSLPCCYCFLIWMSKCWRLTGT